MHFFHDIGVSFVLESSFTPRKLRFSGRHFLALKKKSLFLEVPLRAFAYELVLRRLYSYTALLSLASVVVTAPVVRSGRARHSGTHKLRQTQLCR